MDENHAVLLDVVGRAETEVPLVLHLGGLDEVPELGERVTHWDELHVYLLMYLCNQSLGFFLILSWFE